MKQRCLNPNHKQYKYYGGRGILVCDRWMHSFENFRDDMGPKPSQKHTLDRVDVDGNYEPSNCRWATRSEQSRNMRVRTHCPNGHEYAVHGFYLKRGGATRTCKACHRKWTRRQ